MNRRNFLRLLCWLPFVKMPKFLDGVDYGTDSPLDDVEGFETRLVWDDVAGRWEYDVFPTQIAIDYDDPSSGWSGCAQTNAGLDREIGLVNLEIEHLPTKDVLWFCVDGDRICVGEMLPEVTVSWWVEPRTRHTVCCEYVPLFEVPADGQTHFVAIAWENGHPVKAYLDSDAVWFSDVKLDEEIVQSQWGYIW